MSGFPSRLDLRKWMKACNKSIQGMYFPKSASMWVLLAVLVAALTMLLFVYFQGGLETAFPPPEPSGWMPGTVGTIAG